MNPAPFKYGNLFLIVVLLVAFCTAATTATEVKFLRGSLKRVQRTASEKGKLYFVNFEAAWCEPCRQMNKHTYTDPALSFYIRQHYVAAKIDVDDFDGVIYKEKYNVKVLPTILIFDATGKLLGRYEEAFSAHRMLEVLKQHNISKQAAHTSTAPERESPNFSPAPGSISRPPLVPEKPAAPLQTEPEQPLDLHANSLYQFDVSQKSYEGFSVQIGVFGTVENVLSETSKLNKLFAEPVLIHISNSAGKTLYRVLIGIFEEKNQAEKYIRVLREQEYEGFVKDLARLK